MTTALTRPDRPRQLDDHDHDHDQRTHRHPLDEFVSDPSDLTPICDERRFAAILEEMVADEAPRLFAVVQEYGDRVDGRIAAWGMAFADHAEVVSVTRGLRMSLHAPDDALRLYKFGSHIRARLVWFNPDAATPIDDDDEAA
ncbi:hypothetical protein [Actinokineospora sp.]|uniref:hypothetical protein n=1 Tax=Actinokineospora sp. TaxID=1872133 RepID=UPI00403823EF